MNFLSYLFRDTKFLNMNERKQFYFQFSLIVVLRMSQNKF